MMMVADMPPPPMIERPARRSEAVHGIAVWGDRSLLRTLQGVVAERGWTTRWMVVGEDNLMLLIVVLPTSSPEEVTALVNAINDKQFGELIAGLAQVGGTD